MFLFDLLQEREKKDPTYAHCQLLQIDLYTYTHNRGLQKDTKWKMISIKFGVGDVCHLCV